MASTSTTAPTAAAQVPPTASPEPPYHHPDFLTAENAVVLQSADNTLFRFDREVLRTASSFFRDLDELALETDGKEKVIPFPTTPASAIAFTLSLLRDHYNPTSRTPLAWPDADLLDAVIDFIRAHRILPAADAFFTRSSGAVLNYQCLQRIILGAVGGLPTERIQEVCNKTVLYEVARNRGARAQRHLSQYPAVENLLLHTHLDWKKRVQDWKRETYDELATNFFLGPYRSDVLADFNVKIGRRLEKLVQARPQEVVNTVLDVVPFQFQQVRDFLTARIFRFRDFVASTYGILPPLHDDPEFSRLTHL
ncbi:uncharacterized protein LOC62_04G006579 [Vanrija pseudolonga]|uniref:BTB domain-containing protein n=1 Tax=Vanrija pseudolonga TaxID=143232 RepID=A0AAF1BS79_9TREE|nr:hypothetical protein LOC62_04G006579 [Vanrija pseudolonga]